MPSRCCDQTSSEATNLESRSVSGKVLPVYRESNMAMKGRKQSQAEDNMTGDGTNLDGYHWSSERGQIQLGMPGALPRQHPPDSGRVLRARANRHQTGGGG